MGFRNMLKICLVFWKSELRCDYKRYAYKKQHVSILLKGVFFIKTILNPIMVCRCLTRIPKQSQRRLKERITFIAKNIVVA